jgi:hypothetical protein
MGRISLLWILHVVIVMIVSSRRIGDRFPVILLNQDDQAQLYHELQFCVNTQLSFEQEVRFKFGGIITDRLSIDSDWILRIHSHNQFVKSYEAQAVAKTHRAKNELNVQVVWDSCSFDSDEVFAMQILFAFGSITSIAVVLAVLLDIRLRTSEKGS